MIEIVIHPNRLFALGEYDLGDPEKLREYFDKLREMPGTRLEPIIVTRNSCFTEDLPERVVRCRTLNELILDWERLSLGKIWYINTVPIEERVKKLIKESMIPEDMIAAYHHARS